MEGLSLLEILIKDEVLITVSCPIFPSILRAKYLKGRSPYNGRLSDFSFYIESQISVHREFKK